MYRRYATHYIKRKSKDWIDTVKNPESSEYHCPLSVMWQQTAISHVYSIPNLLINNHAKFGGTKKSVQNSK